MNGWVWLFVAGMVIAPAVALGLGRALAARSRQLPCVDEDERDEERRWAA